ncbi:MULTISPECIES: YfbM family protein [unclassified Nocardioides]|uniref:YfbM family protein n=1 Tax=unclassified Nocardioides TaxID=2615069 RepID=UPI0007032582|nr:MULTISPECIES: YfbM family protein [unclassified Nocardioides]KRC46101.1 hypothetical protein ASE19_19685 [Nocardioides sp. Root79]KRC69449.1 hypothetical protein ASE20_12540 [Nocardioides sp. Root240]
MGLQAAYTRIDEATLDRLTDLDPDHLVDEIDRLEEGGAPTTYLDKMWDGLHFALTGVPASAPIEGDRLSEAVVGVHAFDSDDFIGCTEAGELTAIVTALEAVDIDAVLARQDFAAFAAAEVYPSVWGEDPVRLRADLAEAFALLVEAHRAAASAGDHLLVTIF